MFCNSKSITTSVLLCTQMNSLVKCRNPDGTITNTFVPEAVYKLLEREKMIHVDEDEAVVEDLRQARRTTEIFFL